MKPFTLMLLAFLLLGAVGCRTQRHAFPGHSADEVWTAMLAVAQTPDYHDPDPTERWSVRENHVWADESTSRIEVFRKLERHIYKPSTDQHEERDWKFQITLEEDDPPTVGFKARNLGVPAHAWIEAERFFNEVHEVLGDAPEEDESESDDAAFDMDDLEPVK